MRIATFNVNSLRVRQKIFLDWLEEAQPDVVCLQELKMKEEKFPTKALADAGYEHQTVWGQATYNGVAMISKTPIENPYTGFRV
ncbi:MAG: exodeoxyribonuclease-3, partial [Myxococcota bacterium]